MNMKLNPKWINEMEEKIRTSQKIEYTSEFKICIQWLIKQLTYYKIPFILKSLGCGVSSLTTDTKICPFCKREIKDI
jgi:hypothetical protein